MNTPFLSNPGPPRLALRFACSLTQNRKLSCYQKGEQTVKYLHTRPSLPCSAFLCGITIIVVPFGPSCRAMVGALIPAAGLLDATDLR